MAKDQNGNELALEQFVEIELNNNLIKGYIKEMTEGGLALSMAQPGQPSAQQITPGKIVVMCPVTVNFHPQSPIIGNIKRLVEPPKETTNEPQQNGAAASAKKIRLV